MDKKEFIEEAIEQILEDPYRYDDSLIQVYDADDLHDILLGCYEDDKYDEFVKHLDEIDDDDIEYINDVIRDASHDQREEDMQTYYSMIGL